MPADSELFVPIGFTFLTRTGFSGGDPAKVFYRQCPTLQGYLRSSSFNQPLPGASPDPHPSFNPPGVSPLYFPPPRPSGWPAAG